jgi:hypothetical protein
MPPKKRSNQTTAPLEQQAAPSVAKVYWMVEWAEVGLLIARASPMPCAAFSIAVDIFNVTSGAWSTAALSVARTALAATSLPNLGVAIFAGGQGMCCHVYFRVFACCEKYFCGVRVVSQFENRMREWVKVGLLISRLAQRAAATSSMMWTSSPRQLQQLPPQHQRPQRHPQRHPAARQIPPPPPLHRHFQL